jgi:Concanavalin A-like lectin/glucanases superfamily/Secretion system C-terminal sorting domain
VFFKFGEKSPTKIENFYYLINNFEIKIYNVMKRLLLVVALLCFLVNTKIQAQNIPNYVSPSGLLLWYPFTSNVIDSSGNLNNGTVNGATLSTNRFASTNSCYSFNGLTNRITAPSSSSLNPNYISVSVWVKPTMYTNSWQYIIDKSLDVSNTYDSRGWAIRMTNTGIIELEFRANGIMSPVFSTTTIPLNTWSHIVFTFNGSQLKLYFNNTNVFNQNITGLVTPNTSDLSIGYLPHVNMPPYGYFWNGLIDDIGIWNRPLTPCEINNLYNASLHTTNISTPTSNTICPGDSINLSTTNTVGYTYQWYLNSSPIAGATLSNYKASQAGSYKVVSNYSGCLDTSAAILLSIAPTTPISITSSQPTVCLGNSVTCSCNIPANCSIVWQSNGINSGVSTNTYSVNQTSTINAVCTNSYGCKSNSNSIAVNVLPLPNVQCTASGPTSICTGDSVKLNALINTSYTYQWYLNGVLMPNKTAPTLYATAAGVYTYTAQLNGCSQTSNAITVNVSNTPEASIVAQSTTIICNGQGVLLQAVPGTGYSYQWTMNGFDIAGATNATYMATIGSYYTVKISNGACYGVSQPITVTVNSNPSAIIHWNGTQLFSPIVFSTYQWYLNGVLIPGATGQYYTPTQNGVYYVLVGNDNGCQSISPNYNLLTLSVSNITTPSLQLYPNPTTGMLQVDNFKEGTLYVYNALGQLIIQQSKSIIDLSKQANGIYHIRAYNQAQELIGIGRVVKE